MASDVDGTLLDPTDRIPPRVVAAVGRLTAAGVPFVLVTGRPPRWIPPVCADLGHAGTAVCGNGAVLYDAAADRVVGARTLDSALLAELGEAVAAVLPHAHVAVERVPVTAADDAFWAEPGYHSVWDGPHHEHVLERAELLAEVAVKLLVRAPGLTSAEIDALLAPAVAGRADLTWSWGGGLVEIGPPGVTKATGLAEVATALGIAAADVVAFGDMPNDLEMLRWAGHGVAMGNGHPAVHAVADEVTGTQRRRRPGDGPGALVLRVRPSPRLAQAQTPTRGPVRESGSPPARVAP